MAADTQFRFEPFRLEVSNEQLWRGGQTLPLTGKAFRVLRHLVEHAGQLVTKDALFEAVWPETVVTDGVLSNCIGELRKALGDAAQAPHFIGTVHRRGYRFIAPVTRVGGAEPTAYPGSVPAPPSPDLPSLLVGREAEMQVLHGWLEHALKGQRQVAFITGEAGIGKTTMVDAFLGTLTGPTPAWVAWGQCIAHYGAGEAYLPVLDALGRLCRTPGHEHLVGLLSQHAPTWLVQMPALLDSVGREEVQRKVQGATRERMLRELAEALEVLTAEQPLVLVLEDLHWSDHATVNLIARLARRPEPARLLLLGTYRPVDVIVRGHPLNALKQDLALHRQCVELRLEGLSEAAVERYLRARFPGALLPDGLVRALHSHTEGQPLFMVQTVDAWVEEGWMQEVGDGWVMRVGLQDVQTRVPESVRDMITRQFDGLGPEAQGILEAASVAGVDFTTAAVAAGVEGTMEQVEKRCETLARRGQFLQSRGEEEWPDGTVTGRYAFVHALHRQVVYQRVPVGRRMQMHHRIGVRAEAGFLERANERAAELAVHFDHGRDYPRAARYMQQAASSALRRHAYHEGITHLTGALDLLRRLPEGPEHSRQELAVQIKLASTMTALKGYAAPEVEHAYVRARELCERVGDPLGHFRVLAGLCALYLQRGELPRALELGEQCLVLAQQQQDPALVSAARLALGHVLYYRGAFVEAHTHLEAGLVLRAQRQPAPTSRYGQDLGVVYRSYVGWILWLLGYPDQALRWALDNLEAARELADPYSLVHALTATAVLHQLRREARLAQEKAEAAMALAHEHGFPFFAAWAGMLRGWAQATLGEHQAGIAQLQDGLVAHHATAATLGRPYYLALLAEVWAWAGRAGAGLSTIDEALAAGHQMGMRNYESELYRLKGELLLQANGTASGRSSRDAAEPQLQQALDVARQQQARSFELRATVSLARLWQRQGKRTQAYELLAPAYQWFTEGFDTADLQEAKALLDELAHRSVSQTAGRAAR